MSEGRRPPLLPGRTTPLICRIRSKEGGGTSFKYGKGADCQQKEKDAHLLERKACLFSSWGLAARRKKGRTGKYIKERGTPQPKGGGISNCKKIDVIEPPKGRPR